MPDPDEFGMIILTITRNEIEAFDHSTALGFLEDIKKMALKYEGKLNIIFTGYDEDPRELNEIPEVKLYFDFLDRCFPYWFFFLIKSLPSKYSPLPLILSLVVPIKKKTLANADTQFMEFEETRFEEFMNVHFCALNELTDELKLPLEENMRISKEVIANI